MHIQQGHTALLGDPVQLPFPDFRGLFLEQDEAYRDSVIPSRLWARMAIEAGVPQGWHRLVGPLGEVVGIEKRYGASAPGKELMEHYGFTGPQVAERARTLLASYPARAKALAETLSASG